ncbi:TraV family lipoprotein [Shewanella sp. SM101]|jgi:conjugal transfer pilus assembly protein TraV|uniref:TraV family lipoprotein n=1 Tax=Shewanella TaxID=22 RepID=UPI0021D90BAC|nr:MULTISPECIES: TraV family lipoprotein [unclassified Shewanella]MCU8009956.1 TraV family lipoprotein [Shewanella sp. SM87]MCU8107112.1 TraV family lipoprotein [Shewanella sp. SM101]
MLNQFKLGCITVGLASLFGCASMFETGEEPTVCANNTNSGLPCTSTRDILKYADTPGGIAAEKNRRLEAEDNDVKVSKNVVADQAQSGYGQSIDLNQVREAYTFTADLNRALPAPEPMAVRQPPKMLRVAFAPWQDERGRLQNVGYVYAEVEIRKYTYGREAFNMPAQITPLYIRQQSIEDERNGNPTSINGVGIKTTKKQFNADVEAAKAVLDQAPKAMKDALEFQNK